MYGGEIEINSMWNFRVERNRMLGKVRRWWVWMGKEEGEQLNEILG